MHEKNVNKLLLEIKGRNSKNELNAEEAYNILRRTV